MPQFAPAVQLSALDGTTGFKINGKDAGDLSGWSVDSAGDVNGDGFADVIIGAFGQSNLAGASYVVFGKASGFDPTLELSSLDGNTGFRIMGEVSGDYSGMSVASAGDINGDGFDDVIIGAPHADPNGQEEGMSYVVFGKASGFLPTLVLSTLDGSNGFQINGKTAYDNSGWSVASAGDINGDGFDDLIIGAEEADSLTPGISHVVFGKASGFNANLDLSSLNGSNGFQISGANPFYALGWSVDSAGDVNGDGFDDVIIGSRYGDSLSSGVSYVVFGNGTPGSFPANVNLSTLDGNNGFRINSLASLSNTGFSVASAGDVNGDGFDDVIVGAWSFGFPDNAGATVVLFGKADFAANVSVAGLDPRKGFRLDGEIFDRAGYSVASAGDFNGDGFDDVIIGASGKNKAYVVFGKESGFGTSLDLPSLDGNNGFQINGLALSEGVGFSAASAGDINNDGFDDLIVGARDADPNGNNSGASYIIFGHKSGEAFAFSGGEAGQTTHGSDFNDTLDGHGGNDTLIGHDGNDTLDGGDGLDTLTGGNGDDLYLTDGADTLVESAGGGTDTVVFSGNFTLAAEFENLALTGLGVTGNGNAKDNFIFGSRVSNNLFGFDGNDTLDGGEGVDTLTGGDGDDTYTTDGHDTIVELAGGGTDTVNSSANITLASEVENLNLTGSATIGKGNDGVNVITGGTGASELYGYGGADTLTSGANNDLLDGGAGADSLTGGAGDDTYYTDGLDTLTEGTGGGVDTVRSSASLTLGADFENLVLGGTASTGRGNAAANQILGNDAANKLYGLVGNDTLWSGANNDVLDGGAGADSLTGGAGNDTYYTDGFDTLVEDAGGGVDTVRSSVNFTLATDFENLVLLGTVNTGRGNAAANVISGNASANKLYGLVGNDTLSAGSGIDWLDGGAGRDIMSGGAGNDVFDFNTIAEAGNSVATRDRITDFTHLADDINLATIDASTKATGNNAFVFIGTAAFHKVAGELRYQKFDLAGTSKDTTVVSADVNGDAKADFQIELSGLKTLTAVDFVL